MLRIAFARKNKTLSAEFKNKKVVEILEKNYRTHCSVNNQPIGMDFDMVNLIDESLKDNDMNEKRARQMDIGIGYRNVAIRKRWEYWRKYQTRWL